jgi:hypothetical protein
MNMKNMLIASVTAAMFATSVAAADFGGEVGAEVTKNAAGDYVATPTIELSFGAKTEGATFFGGIGVEADDTDNITVDTWYVGANFGATALSFGDQEDLFDFGGLEVVGGETLANPADDHESLIVRHGEFAGLVGFTDISADIGEVENVQLAYAKDYGTVNIAAAVDYNLNTEAYIVAVSADSNVTEVVNLGATLTYDDAASLLAYETVGTYEFNSDLAVSGFVNGDETDMAQNVGAGVVYTKDSLKAFAEVSYNLDTDEVAPAVGVSFSF